MELIGNVDFFENTGKKAIRTEATARLNFDLLCLV